MKTCQYNILIENFLNNEITITISGFCQVIFSLYRLNSFINKNFIFSTSILTFFTYKFVILYYT